MKPIRFAVIVALALLTIATGTLLFQNHKTSTALQSLKTADEATRNRYAQTLDVVAEIQDSLNAISLGDTNVRMLSDAVESEQHLSGPDSQDALDRIATLRASIMRSRDRIEQLESSLKASGIKIAGLQRLIGGLKTTLSEKETMVAQLSTQVDSLQTEVTGLATAVQESQDTIRVKENVIEDKRRQLATVYYIVGDKKTLTKSGVLVAKGGVLGMGKTLLPSPGSNPQLFSTLDTDQETVVRTTAAKVQVISAQPLSSYELKLVDGHMELHILNPEEFRKIKQLVIMTA